MKLLLDQSLTHKLPDTLFAYLIPFAIQVAWFILNKRAEKKATRHS